MDSTLQQAYAQATSANTVYNNNISRWQFLYDSYVGGEAYRAGGYLNAYRDWETTWELPL